MRGRPVRGLKGTGRSFIRRERLEVATTIQDEAGLIQNNSGLPKDLPAAIGHTRPKWGKVIGAANIKVE